MIKKVVPLLALTTASIMNIGAVETQRPNYVIIFLDDMGYGDLSCTGALGYKTPNIDQMANQGIRFTNFFVAQAVCGASRAGLLSGCYPNRIGIAGAPMPNSPIGINPDEEIIPELLQRVGYKTGMFGKWHLGDHKKFMPLNNGFDEYCGIPYSNDMWPFHPQIKTFPDLPLYEGDSIIALNPDQSQFTKKFTERAVDFINRNKEDPFFLYLAHPMPHVPIFASEDFKGKSEAGLFGDVMMELDWSVGEILTALRKNGLDKNTLVIFTSDNGPWANYGNHAGSSGGLREGKGTSWEGGQRVPCIMMWTGKIQPGLICNRLASTIDFLPTLVELSNANLPVKKIDGVSLTSLLFNLEDANPRSHFLYYYQKNSLEAVTDGRWKLVFPHKFRSYEKNQPGNDGNPGKTAEGETGLMLYDLRRDQGERYDVKQSYPDVVNSLLNIANIAREDLGDDLTDSPGKNQREPGKL